MFFPLDSRSRKNKTVFFSEAAFDSSVAGIPTENGQNSELYMHVTKKITNENDFFSVMCMPCVSHVHSSYDVVEKSLSYIE